MAMIPIDETVSDAANLLNFSSLAIRPKEHKNTPPKSTLELSKEDAGSNDKKCFDHAELVMTAGVQDQLWDLTVDEGFFASEEFLQSVTDSRGRRRQSKRKAAARDKALRKTASGRVGKTWKTQISGRSPGTSKRLHHKKHTSALGERTRRLLPARQFLRQRVSMSSSAASVPALVSPEEIWESMQTIPGFALPPSLPLDLGDRLGQLLVNPFIVRKCGRSLKRRRLPNFIIMMLTFPIQTHHGRGTFERDCGYTPGDENSPAFWKRFADAFSVWLGMIPATTTTHTDPPNDDMFDGGILLQRLVTFFSSARVKFLYQTHDMPTTESTQQQNSALSGKAPRSRRRNTIVDTGEDDEDDMVVSNLILDDVDKALPKNSPPPPTQIQRRVSIAADAWLMFLDKSRGADFDPEMLAELCI